MDTDLSTGEKTVLVGGGVVIAGALLPWASGDGIGLGLAREILALVLGFAAFGLVYAADWTDTAQLLAAALGALTLGVAGVTLAEAFDIIGDGSIGAGVGVYVTLLAGVLFLVGGLRAYTDSTPDAGMYSHR